MEEDRALVDVRSQVVARGAQPEQQCCERGGRTGGEHRLAHQEMRTLHGGDKPTARGGACSFLAVNRAAFPSRRGQSGTRHYASRDERRDRCRAQADGRGRRRDPRRGRQRRRRLPRCRFRLLGRREPADRARRRAASCSCTGPATGRIACSTSSSRCRERAPAAPVEPHMESIDIDFDGSSSQVFLVGPGSCAVPGAVAGLEAAHERYGSLPWRRLIEPAIALARDGVELTRPQAYLHAILDLILRHTPEGRAIYGEHGRIAAGERVVMRDLADTLERLAEGGARELYGGELGRAVVEHLSEHGGLITEEDLAGYRVIWRRPLRVPYEGREFVSNPPPSSGGILIGYGLSLLDRLSADGGPGSAQAIEALVEVMREQSRARGGSFGSDLYRGGLVRQALLRGEPRRGPRSHRAARGRGARAARRAGNDAHLGRRRARQRRVADRVDRLRLRRDRPRHRHPHEQHARRVRPEPAGQPGPPGRPPDEHDGAVAGPRPRAAAPRRRQRRLDQAAGRDHADRGQRRPPRHARRGGDRGSARPRRQRPCPLRGRLRPGRARPPREPRLRAHPLAPSEPLLRRRLGRRAAGRRRPRGGR